MLWSGSAGWGRVMSLMLPSVTGPEEAEIVVRQGADIVDLKDVVAGFGTVTPEVVRATVAAVRPPQAARRRVSVPDHEKVRPNAVAPAGGRAIRHHDRRSVRSG